MTRDTIFEEDRGERQYYRTALVSQEVFLPITKDGFEALLEYTAEINRLPPDDLMRQVLAGYIHHIPNEENTITMEKLAKVMYKSVSNSTTWKIDQEVKKKIRDEAIQAANEVKDNVVAITPGETNGV